MAVVIPVLNRPRSVLEALDSVHAQSVLPEKIIVVDDGSTDATAAAVRAWITEHDRGGRAHLEQQPQRGVAVARNTGLALGGDQRYVAFLDSDDLWPGDFLERTVAALEEQPEAVAASCDRRRTSSRSGAEVIDTLSPFADSPTSWLFANGGGVLSCSLLRAQAVRALGGFQADLPTGQDSELLLRLSMQGRWCHAPGAPVTFRRDVARERGERGHIRHAYFDYKRTWALIHERFVTTHGGAAAMPDLWWRRELANRWTSAARQLLACGRPAEARTSYRRSLRHRFRVTTLWHLATSYIPRRTRKVAGLPSSRPKGW